MHQVDRQEQRSTAQAKHPPALQPTTTALFLDFDGTLSELAPTPDAAHLSQSMLRAVSAAQAALDGRLAIISGRSLAMLERLIPIPGLALAGVHGLERRFANGEVDRPAPPQGLAAARARLLEFAAREPGLMLEDKGLSIALHYRANPGLAPLAHARAHSLADSLGLIVQTGKMVVELRPPGADKGAAVRHFMASPPFKGARPLFVGDDDTDESAFAAAADLGGHGIRVGAHPHGSAASFSLPTVAAVERWLTGATQ